MVKQLCFFLLACVLSCCSSHAIDFKQAALPYQIEIHGSHPHLKHALEHHAAHQKGPSQYTLHIGATKTIRPLNAMIHQQNALAYQLTYALHLRITDAKNQAKFPEADFKSTTQLLLPFHQSIEQGEETQRIWRHLSEDLANQTLLYLLHQHRFIDHA